MDEDGGKKVPIFRDRRRYYYDYCGICRSKKALITSHMLSHHKEEMEDKKANGEDGDEEVSEKSSNTCEECRASFRKPGYLKQHMQSHSLEMIVIQATEDHLTRHLLQHQGKLFTCPIENCNRKFAFQANMKRHVSELHDEESPSCMHQN